MAEPSARSGLRLAWELLLRYPRQSVTVVVLLLFAGLLEGFGVATVLPLLGMVAGDATAEPSKLDQIVFAAFEAVGLAPTLGNLLLVIVAGMVGKAALVLLAMREVGSAMAYVAHRLRLALVRALMLARWSYFTRQPAGSLANAVTSESSGAGAAFWAAANICTSALQVAIYLALAALVSWQVTAAAIAAGGALFVGLSFLIKVSRRAGKQAVAAYNSLLSRLVDGLAGIKAIKAMALEERFAPMLETDNRTLFSAQRRLLVAKEALIALHEPVIVIFLAAGLFALASWRPTPLDTLMMMALLFQRTVTRLGKLQSAYQQLAAAEDSYAAIRRKIAEAEASRERHEGRKPPRLERDIVLKDVSFAYGDEPVLRRASLTVPVGRITALHGPSGSGKSTLVDLILGLHAPSSGAVLVDGVPLSELDIAAWRDQIGYVPQELFLFHDSVLNNVTLGDPRLSREDALRALGQAGAAEFVAALPQGLDTIVGERGALLSGGQRQRIAIARALARRPRLLILDEPTTALDPATEAEICETLRRLGGEVTVLAISHQPAIVEIADVVYRMRDGYVERVEPRAAAAAG